MQWSMVLNSVAFDGDNRLSAVEYAGRPEPGMPGSIADPAVLQQMMNMHNATDQT